MRRASVGREYPCSEDSMKICDEAGSLGFDFVSTVIAHPWCCYNSENIPDDLPPITRPDLMETCKNVLNLFVAKVSPWIDVDSTDDRFRKLSEKALRAELTYYTYLNVAAIQIELKNERHRNLAKIVSEYVNVEKGSMMWIVVPINTTEGKCVDVDTKVSRNERSDPWHWFYSFRLACNNKERLGLALKFTSNIPDPNSPEMKRWYGEPLKTIVIDTSLFTMEKMSPVLDTSYETMIKNFYALNIQILITGPEKDEKMSNANLKQIKSTHSAYFTYLNNLYEKQPECPYEMYRALGYEDKLYLPAHPMIDTLSYFTYDSYESDKRKYRRYKDALTSLLANVIWNQNNGKELKLVVMVLGAGRGPLVTAIMDALSNNSNGANVKVYAVEKNPNAIVTLNHMLETKWAEKNVTIVNSYFKEFHPPDDDKADIIVSELLGAFGDNELSPECLDGALHLMKKSCLSIPHSYTSYICPIMSPKLHNYVTICDAVIESPRELLKAYETTYVVRPLNHFTVDDPKPLFTFNHPNFDEVSNDRYNEVTFFATASCEVHGLLGFFRAWLYEEFRLTILPRQHTPGLFSWFPMFFPFREPIYVKKGQKIVVNFWRCSDSRHVWYEWCLSKPIQTPIMNCKGRSCVIRKL